LEVHTENYLCGGPMRRALERARADWPVSLHGVGLSLGSPALDDDHLGRVAALADEIEPMLVSEHLAWSASRGRYLNDLLPLPYTDETFAVVGRNIDRLQNRLGRRVLIENPSRYLRCRGSIYEEADFLDALAGWTGCGILCDVNNIYVTCRNLGGDPYAYLDVLAGEDVLEIHLAGHTVVEADGEQIHIDDHGSPVAAAVWRLYAHAVRRFPTAVTLVEWDSNLPSLPVLVAEASKASVAHRQALQSLDDVAA
jgi:hypothetical protein